MYNTCDLSRPVWLGVDSSGFTRETPYFKRKGRLTKHASATPTNAIKMFIRDGADPMDSSYRWNGW